MINIQKLWDSNKTVHNFKDSLKLGDLGESIMSYFLMQGSEVQSIKSVAKDPYYQEKDIDLIVTLKDGRTITVEIKTDTYDKNFFYELISNTTYNTLGCLEKTEADCIIYYFINLEEVYFINRIQFQKWFHAHENDKIYKYGKYVNAMEEKTLYNRDRAGTGVYQTIGKVFSREYFENNFDGCFVRYRLHNINYNWFIKQILNTNVA